MTKVFITVSGLPGSGKTVLAHRLAPSLSLPVVDRDDILQRLFEIRGIGDREWRRALSRESDELLRQAALNLQHAILVSFWHVPGMPGDVGTPTDWLDEATDRVVNVHCACPPAIAAARFMDRMRHPGHGDRARSAAELVVEFEALAALGRPTIARQVTVDTSAAVHVADVLEEVRAQLDAA